MQTILIADDSSTARMIIRRCLEIAGCLECRFLEAANGEQALTILGREQVDLLVTDLNMPVMDGHRLLAHVRSMPKLEPMPVLVITSQGNPVLEAHLIEQGADRVIPKPITPGGLQKVLAELFQKGFRETSAEPGWSRDILVQAVTQTFEEVAFEEILLRDLRTSRGGGPTALLADGQALWARLDLLEPLTGEILLVCPRALVARMVSSIHGMPPEEAPGPLVEDTLAELLNTVAGRVMAGWLQQKKRFGIGLPRTGTGPAPSPASDACQAHFSVGEEDLYLFFPAALIG